MTMSLKCWKCPGLISSANGVLQDVTGEQTPTHYLVQVLDGDMPHVKLSN